MSTNTHIFVHIKGHNTLYLDEMMLRRRKWQLECFNEWCNLVTKVSIAKNANFLIHPQVS